MGLSGGFLHFRTTKDSDGLHFPAVSADEDNFPSAEQRVERARGLFQAGKLEEAAQELRRAIAADPERGDWHHNLAVTLDALGRHADALASYERALELVPNHVASLVGAAQGSIRAGHFERALKFCERAISIDRTIEPAYALRIHALGMLGRVEDAESVYYIAQHTLKEMPVCLAEMANVLARSGKFERAIWCYREAIAQAPRLPAVKARLGAALLRSGQAESSLQVLMQAIREQPGDTGALLTLGRALESLGRLNEAEEKYRRILELEPANHGAHVALGDIALRSGKLEDARATYTLVLSLGSQDQSIRLRLIEVLAKLGHREESARRLRELFAKGSVPADSFVLQDPVIALGAAGTAIECGEPRTAAIILRAATRAFPSNIQIRQRLARALFESGEPRGARRAARAALRLDRTDAITLHNIALSALQRGELRLARAALLRGLRAHPLDRGLRRLRSKWMLHSTAALLRRTSEEPRTALRQWTATIQAMRWLWSSVKSRRS
jgi:tetratricopeptide (TPR) repeat protein